MDGRVRRELAGLEDEGVTGSQARCDLPGDLEQRVVPRRDESADADRLVHDAADDAGIAGVDHAAGLGVGDVAEVPHHRDDVGDVVLALDQALAGVKGLGLGDDRGVALEEVGQPQQQVAALARRGARPGSGVECLAGRGDRGAGVVRAGLVDLGHERAVGGAADLPAPAFLSADPCPRDPVVRHPSRFRRVAHRATGCL
jgi:hypothetical protein